jgi:hypothetical protein
MKAGKIAEAQEIIMRKLNEQLGGQARAQLDSYSGSIANMGKQWEEVGEKIGGFFAKMVSDFSRLLFLPGMKALRQEGKDYADELKNIADKTGIVVTNLSDFARAGKIFSEQKTIAKALADEWYRVSQLTGMAIRSEKEYEEAYKVISGWMANVRNAGPLAQPQLIIDEGKMAKLAYNLTAVKKEWQDAEEAARGYSETMARIEDQALFFADAVAGLSDTFFDMAQNSKDALQILGDYFSRLVQSMIGDLVRLQAYKWFWNTFQVAAPALAGTGGFSTGSDVGYHGNYGPNQSSGSGVTLNVIDQRMAGSPDISAKSKTSAGGKQTIEIIVGDALTGMFNTGKLDKLMKGYGVNRAVTVG